MIIFSGLFWPFTGRNVQDTVEDFGRNYHGYATEQFCLHKESVLAFLAFFDLFWPFSVMALVQHQLGP